LKHSFNFAFPRQQLRRYPAQMLFCFNLYPAFLQGFEGNLIAITTRTAPLL
jgi:hypothetical protein